MSQLPIDAVIPDLIDGLATYPQILLSAPPGAGKSTRLPLALLEQASLPGKIVLLEPRRLAARNIARYLAQHLGEPIGQTIGLRMRGETKVSAQTRVEVVTEGVLTRLLQTDPMLDGVSVVMFDEFHERSLHADLALALSLDCQAGLRDDLRLVVMSATLDNHALAQHLPDALTLTTEGRSYPIHYHYHPLSRHSQWASAVASASLDFIAQHAGSALLFLPGVSTIRQVYATLEGRLPDDMDLHRLHGSLDASAQHAAIAPPSPRRRKLVLTTNIAETSLTIEGIRLVIDAGLERMVIHQAQTGIDKLVTRQITRSAAIQRAGRAGRLEEGQCLRLYSEEQFQRLPATPTAPILREDLTDLALNVIQWGCDVKDLHWLDVPPIKHWQAACIRLTQLGLIDTRQGLTALGQRAIQLAASPRAAAMLARAEKEDTSVLSTACWLAAWADKPMTSRSSLALVDQLQSVMAHKDYQDRAQSLARTLGIRLQRSLDEAMLPLLAANTWPDRVALRRGKAGRFMMANSHGVTLDSQDALSHAEAIVVCDVMAGEQHDSRAYSAIALSLDTLQQMRPDLLRQHEVVQWDDHRGTLIAEKQQRLGELVLYREPLNTLSAEQQAQGLLDAVRQKGIDALNWQRSSQSLLTRARCAQAWGLDIMLPPLSDDDLLASLDTWLAPFVHGMSRWQALQQLDLKPVLEAWFGFAVTQQLNAALPTHMTVPTGSRYPLRYTPDSAPVLAVKMQEMYGQADTPTLANGKVAVQVELLSPAGRPLQITQDLAGFWQGSYKEVQKEMKGRYPKHLWPDDPANHAPTRKTKRHFNQS
ncbi:ATP-dependent helicase HrpB [Salinivibrio kushneri]|uniref:ATP-dependent helicase HrpB n=1 Tax=Salinivibrio kushneri TaxID=1908198 RepID=A0AB36K9B9_9GAMM|nr:ATP-dependent helicase HrpB [Salinivibrio kushneri]OOE46356.1 ATP-dependent helicase HrpB [Salinivibrio kushneri]OOE48191.1 ATP-dependent helicase HrpB [Salinivibrio kushneri]